MKSLKIGDKVIYPNQGLGVVEAIHEEAHYGENLTVFHLRIIANNTLVTVPSASALEIGIRRPVTEGSIRKIYEYIGNGDDRRHHGLEGALQGAPQPDEVGDPLRHGHRAEEPLLT
ncbi:MAG: hypothetical protein MZU79_05335 [Anaerotruncus sp.]|nr:hypothetical protein [Anaerotruncus sp.]